MKDLSAVLRNDKKKSQWYETEKNTASLIAAVLSARRANTLDGDDLWNLVRLCWITTGIKHWRKSTIPALAGLFPDLSIRISHELKSTINSAGLPEAVATAARENTGFVNFRNVWRKSSREWCQHHALALRRIVFDTLGLDRSEDKKRLAISESLERLPNISSPTGASKVSPIVFFTPLIACLDPSKRFPVINGRKGVRNLLTSLGVANNSLSSQVKGMTGLIGHFGLSDSLMIDVLADDIARLGPELSNLRSEVDRHLEGSALPDYDEAEREAVMKSRTVAYRDRHDKMTNKLKDIFESLELKRGTARNCRYDVLLKNYDANGRDLLMEVKPDPDKGSLRIAIGQIFDYRRFLPKQAATDLAILTISRPTTPYIDLLTELRVTAVWFVDENLMELNGDGNAWPALSSAIHMR